MFTAILIRTRKYKKKKEMLHSITGSRIKKKDRKVYVTCVSDGTSLPYTTKLISLFRANYSPDGKFLVTLSYKRN